ncbi:voltage-dependent T-type calcium channel subunit alpha-1G-like, partial [Python bivittatus]|uniref:Voltage-dependent T-type calcium channel subunit alpha-1G-like n=1 Tax=Python bivittatus TaxID=176946 RepID=A0A9F5JFK0_PYTBI
IPLAEMEALSLTSDILSENSWSLALTDDSLPDDNNTLLLNALESNTDLPSINDPLILSSNQDLLRVGKPSVGRTHSLPNDSYMFQAPDTGPYDASSGEKNASHQKSQSGSTTSVQSQPASIDAVLHIGRDRFHPLKPQYNLDWESKPKVAPPVRSPCAERLLRRQ